MTATPTATTGGGGLVSPFRDLARDSADVVAHAAEQPSPSWHEAAPDYQPALTRTAIEQALVRSSIAAGRTGVNELTDIVFFRRHPERGGRLISRSEPDFSGLSREWLAIRDTLVVPILTAPSGPVGWRPPGPAAGQPTGPPTGAPTGPPTGGGGQDLSSRFQNGRIPASALCPVRTAPGHLLECSAARAFDRLNAAFRARFGYDVVVNDAYRSYERQVELKRSLGSKAATPGTSNHGWGKALDLAGMNDGVGAVFEWFTANAHRFGWLHPPWARATGSNPEAHHWEFQGG
jgi:D-alanyl-D-alanine carboxypeptidase